MKKILILLIFSILIIILENDSLNQESELARFLREHNLQYENIEPYLQYQSFSHRDFFKIEKIRITENCSHLMALNQYKYQHPSPAIMKGTYLILVNKSFYVEDDYSPNSLVNPQIYGIKIANDDVLVPLEVLSAYEKMISDLKLYNLYIFSGYRSYEKQKILYQYYQDDNYSAKPGHSEHHTGLALDLSILDCGLTLYFQETKEFKILSNNCYKYGFILRYPQGKEKETGYYYEPWHFRYVGIKHATYIMKNNLTLERYLFENYEI